MKFFIPPYTSDDKPELSEEVYVSIRKFAEENLKWNITERRIFSVTYRHEGKEYYAEVGKIEQRTGELICAILESITYLVCTPNRGVLRGEPVLVGKEEIRSIVDFTD